MFKPLDYHIQKDKYSCGPIAILNAIKWAVGENVNDKAILSHLKNVCECRSTEQKQRSGGYSGTLRYGMYQGIVSRPEFLLTEQSDNVSIKGIKKQLDRGSAVIISLKSFRKQGSGHVMLIDKRDGNNYRIVGAENATQSYRWVSNVELRKRIYASNNARTYFPAAWYIRRTP